MIVEATLKKNRKSQAKMRKCVEATYSLKANYHMIIFCGFVDSQRYFA